MNRASLEQAFRSGFGVFWNAGTVDQFFAFIDDRAVAIDEDHPFIMDKAQFRDHIQFHLGSWESFTWVPYETRFDVEGDTGIVSTAFTLRGKPKGSGFRLRHGLATVVCHHQPAGWKAVALTFDALIGHLERASPG
jgi:ketosteroid isomerase-like protein